jgi:hypothetical protein
MAIECWSFEDQWDSTMAILRRIRSAGGAPELKPFESRPTQVVVSTHIWWPGGPELLWLHPAHGGVDNDSDMKSILQYLGQAESPAHSARRIIVRPKSITRGRPG